MQQVELPMKKKISVSLELVRGRKDEQIFIVSA